jgi:hypothetical protein
MGSGCHLIHSSIFKVMKRGRVFHPAGVKERVFETPRIEDP